MARSDKYLRAPFGYVGGKSRALKHVLPHLPYREGYIEPFGGSAAVLLAREPSKLEVYNDRYGGVVAFYRCLRDYKKGEQLAQMLEKTIYSKEDFYFCKDTWEDATDDVERAFKWYYMHCYSFGNKDRQWGRSKGLGGRVRDVWQRFLPVHRRIKKVRFENLDWRKLIEEYDSKNHVFYMDPPYLSSYTGTYRHELSPLDHEDLLEHIFDMDAFVAVSGYSHPLYDNQPWDEVYEWEQFVSVGGHAYSEANGKAETNVKNNNSNLEKLWIKR